MKSFELELRVTDNKTRRWQVCLEKLSSDHTVGQWREPSADKPYFSKHWTEYQIEDDALEVFISCTGLGSSVTCDVLINGTKRPSLKAFFNDSKPAFRSYPITQNTSA